MITKTTKKYLKLIPVSAMALSLILMGKAFAGELTETHLTTSTDQQFQTLINWNQKVSATLSAKMDDKLKLEMQALSMNIPDRPIYANQIIDSTKHDVVLIKADKTGAGITAHSTTPVVVSIDRKELCLLNL